MDRRAVVRGFLGLLGSAVLAPLALPARLLAWGAIRGVAPTHQYIVTRALQALASDPVFPRFPFPRAEQLTEWDFVELSVWSGKTGTGPDMDGLSPYSWHYYNPLRDLGEAPFRAADFFRQMMAQRAQGGDSSQATAWGAHFLADVFVPYHTIGVPASEAHAVFARGSGVFAEIDSGPPQLLYSLTNPPLPGWGLGSDFTAALQLFSDNFPLGSEADWFDPWYFNGYLGGWYPGTAGVATGSHGSWEAWAWNNVSNEALERRVQEFLTESFYDPLWANARASFEEDAWTQQSMAVLRFAKACAGRTRNPVNFEAVLRNPEIGIAAAVRAVMTWFRASVSAISLQWLQEPLADGGYRLRCVIQNGNPGEHLMDVDVRLVYEVGGRWRGGVTRYQGVIGPGQFDSMAWDFPEGQPIQGVLEAVGRYPFTPDLGYARTTFQTVPGRQEVEPEVLATWQGQWTIFARDLIGPMAGQASELGSFEIWVEGTSARFKSTVGPVILPVTVVDNGRCIAIDWFRNGVELRGTLCMAPGGASFTGRLQGSMEGQPMQGDCWGNRVR